MYCKNCGKEYPKEKKICKDCKIALTPGTSPASANKGVNKKFIIIGVVLAAAVIALFLIIGLSGMVPADLKGEWYETTGMGGMLEFMPNGELSYNIFGEDKVGSYEYNSASKKGKLALDEKEMADFTCDGVTIEMDGAKYTRQYVEQMDFSEIFEGIADNLDK